jgi:hypothetical protein
VADEAGAALAGFAGVVPPAGTLVACGVAGFA